MAYEQTSGYHSGLLAGAMDPGSATASPAIDSALVMFTSGDAWWARITAVRGQSAATLTVYAYVTTVTGSPTFQLQVWDGATGSEDDDRPSIGGSNLASSPSTLSLTSADDGTWVALTCTVSLTQGQTYWLIVENTHGTPASNNTTFNIRGAADNFFGTSASTFTQKCGYTTDGFTTDPTEGAGTGTFVVKYSDSTIIGFPWVGVETHASNTNDRGQRFKFSSDVVVSGVASRTASNGFIGIEINEAVGGNNIVTHTFSRHQKLNWPEGRWPPVTLLGGISYDIVQTCSVNVQGFIYHMGEAEGSVPADVLAARPQGWTYVDGTTPGSYATDDSRLSMFMIFIDDNPAGVLVHPGMTGGLNA